MLFSSFLLNRPSAFPFSQFAVFAGGYTTPADTPPEDWGEHAWDGYFTTYTDKYYFLTNIITPGTRLGLKRENLGGAGNYTVGILVGGDTQAIPGNYASGSINTNYTDKYTYATDAVSLGTTLGTGRNELAGSGTAFVAIFAGGANTDHVNIATSEKYTYGNDTVVYGGNLGLARRWLSASSNPVVGIYAGGFISEGQVHVDLYTFSNDSVAPGANLTQPWFARTGTGNFQMALIGGGYKSGVVSTNTDRYTYATSAWTSSTALGLARNQFSAASDPNTAVFAGGVGGAVGTDYTDTYQYSNEVVAPGTKLGVARYCLAGLSTSPAGL